MSSFGVREIKKAKTKLACLDAMLELTKECSFRELKSKDIASHAKITEMTFFNYFSTKEELLVYFMRVKNLEEMARNLQNPLLGISAIRRLFTEIAKEINTHPTIMLSLIGFIASLKAPPKGINIEAPERWLLFPKLEPLQTIHIDGMNEIFLNYLTQIDGLKEHEKILEHLVTLFYGGALNAHIGAKNVTQIYKDGLDLIFQGVSK